MPVEFASRVPCQATYAKARDLTDTRPASAPGSVQPPPTAPLARFNTRPAATIACAHVNIAGPTSDAIAAAAAAVTAAARLSQLR